MKSKSPRRNSNDFYSFDDSVGRPGVTPGKSKRDRKPSIYDEDDDYDYRKDLVNQEEDDNFFSDDQIDDDEFNEDDFEDEDFDDEDFDEDFEEELDDDDQN